MISVRLAFPAVPVAAALAGCFTYFIPPPPLVTVPPTCRKKCRSCARVSRLTLIAQQQRKHRIDSCKPPKPS